MENQPFLTTKTVDVILPELIPTGTYFNIICGKKYSRGINI